MCYKFLNIKKYILILFALCVCNYGLYAQEQEIIAFEKIEKEFDVLLFNQHFSQAFILLEDQHESMNAIEIETRIRLLHLYSKYYLVTDDVTKGKSYAEEAYKLSQESKSELAQAYGLYAMSYYYQQLGLFDMSYDNIRKMMNIINLEDFPYLAYKAYYKLYGIYTYWDDAEQTQYYAQKALDFANFTKDYDKLSNAYAAKAVAMENMYKHTHEKAYQDSIIYYLRRSAFIDPMHEAEVPVRTKIIAKLNLANHFFQELRSNNMQNKAAQDSIVKYLNSIGTIPPDIDQNYDLRAAVLGMKSQVELANGNLDKTEEYLLTAYDNLRKENVNPSFTKLYNITIGLYELYKTQNDYKNAFEYLKINQSYKVLFLMRTKLMRYILLRLNMRMKE